MLQPPLPSPLGNSVISLTDKPLAQSADAIKTQNQSLTDSGSSITLVKSEQLHRSDLASKSKKKSETSRSIFKNLRKVQKSTDNLENYLPVEKSPSNISLLSFLSSFPSTPISLHPIPFHPVPLHRVPLYSSFPILSFFRHLPFFLPLFLLHLYLHLNPLFSGFSLLGIFPFHLHICLINEDMGVQPPPFPHNAPLFHIDNIRG